MAKHGRKSRKAASMKAQTAVKAAEKQAGHPLPPSAKKAIAKQALGVGSNGAPYPPRMNGTPKKHTRRSRYARGIKAAQS